MAIAAEHLYTNCTCTNGMRDGLRCADCNGRGLVPRGVKPSGAAVRPDADEDAVRDELDDMSVNHLRSRAKDLGLSAGGNKETLIRTIREAVADKAAEG